MVLWTFFSPRYPEICLSKQGYPTQYFLNNGSFQSSIYCLMKGYDFTVGCSLIIFYIIYILYILFNEKYFINLCEPQHSTDLALNWHSFNVVHKISKGSKTTATCWNKITPGKGCQQRLLDWIHFLHHGCLLKENLNTFRFAGCILSSEGALTYLLCTCNGHPIAWALCMCIYIYLYL